MRAHLQLTDVVAGEPIWSEQADCKEDDLFALQDQISEQVVTSLGVELLGVGIRISCPLARGQFGQIQIFNGDPVAGVRSARYALHLERVYPPWLLSVLAIGYRDTGEPALAARVAGELVRLSPDDVGAKVVLCSALEMAGRGREASAIAGQILNLDSTFRVHRYVRSQPYRNTEMPERLTVSLERSGLPV